MILSFLSAKSRQTLKSKVTNKYLKPFPRNNTLKSVALAVALGVCPSAFRRMAKKNKNDAYRHNISSCYHVKHLPESYIEIQRGHILLSHLLIAGCDIRVQFIFPSIIPSGRQLLSQLISQYL